MDNWNKSRYETTIVILLALLFGVLVLNRVAVVYLFPFIIDAFHITYAQAGAIASVLAITFALSTWLSGMLSDRYGKKIVLIPSSIFFSLMSWFSGAAGSFASLIFARGLMGVGQGSVLPASIATILIESRPERRGFNFGIQQALSPLIALGIGPILVTQLTRFVQWRTVLMLVGIPSLIIAFVLLFYMREPVLTSAAQDDEHPPTNKPGFFEPLKYRNVFISSIVTPLMLCCSMVFLTFSVVYLTREVGLSVPDAGLLLSMIGVTGFFGCILLPLISDHFGRKTVIVPCLFVLGLSLVGFVLSGGNFVLLGTFASVAGFCLGGTAPLALSALPTESVPPQLAATASGIPVTFGELFGGALMPFLAGYLCDLFGLKAAIYASAAAPLVAGFVAIFYHETAPRVIARRSSQSICAVSIANGG